MLCLSRAPLRLRYLPQHLILGHSLCPFISVGGKFHTKNRSSYRPVYSDVYVFRQQTGR